MCKRMMSAGRLGTTLLLLTNLAAAAEPPLVGLHSEVTFSDYPAQAYAPEVLARLLSPLAWESIRRKLAENHQTLAAQSLDLDAAHFALYIPPQAPAAGYALLVFIPPWSDARLPAGWKEPLDRFGTIFVSAAASGNDASDVERRVPLALIAAGNVIQHYPVDLQRVYVGGFSGGARVALRLALGYPDLFHGALLNAGSDPIDAGPPTPPAAELLRRFQDSSRIVFVTGGDDITHLQMDSDTIGSLRRWCSFNYTVQAMPRAGHEVATSAAFAGALQLLLQRIAANPAKLDACRADVAGKLEQQLTRVADLISRDQRAAAQKLLIDIDRHFGGIATPRSLRLQSDLGWQFASH
jgi:predicted esterase